MIHGKVVLFVWVMRQVEKLGASDIARLSTLVTIHLAVVRQQQLPVALDAPTVQQRSLRVRDIRDVVRKGLAKNRFAFQRLFVFEVWQEENGKERFRELFRGSKKDFLNQMKTI